MLRRRRRLVAPRLRRLVRGTPVSGSTGTRVLEGKGVAGARLAFGRGTNSGMCSLSRRCRSGNAVEFLKVTIVLGFLLGAGQFMPVSRIRADVRCRLLTCFLGIFLTGDGKASRVLLAARSVGLLGRSFVHHSAV